MNRPLAKKSERELWSFLSEFCLPEVIQSFTPLTINMEPEKMMLSQRNLLWADFQVKDVKLQGHKITNLVVETEAGCLGSFFSSLLQQDFIKGQIRWECSDVR